MNLKADACISAFNEERTSANVILKTLRDVDQVVASDGGSGDLMGATIDEITANCVSETGLGFYG